VQLNKAKDNPDDKEKFALNGATRLPENEFDQTKKLILLVDDSKNDATLLMLEFGRVGLANPVVWLRDGSEAISYLSGDGKYQDREAYPVPSIVLLDLNMPNVDGFGVLRWIGTQPELKRLLVIVLSGVEDVKKVNKAYELGANSYLTKPTNRHDLSNLVEFFRGYWIITNRTPEVPQIRSRA